MPSSRHDQEFAREIEANLDATISVSSSALDCAILWISSNLSPDDVFDVKDLQSWAEENGYTKE
jgi:N-dimethylarginine dimethylaminohydrolase